MSNINDPMVDTIREVLIGSSSAAVDEAEAEFRRKAWLALAPLYGVPPFAEESSNDADEDDVMYSNDLQETAGHDIEEAETIRQIPTAEENAVDTINEESSNGKRSEDVCDHENVSVSAPTHARCDVKSREYPREEKQELTSPAEGTVAKIQSGNQRHKSINTGHWTAEENRLFLQGFRVYGNKWTKIALLVQTRTALQVRSHVQKYFLKHDKYNPYLTMREEKQELASPVEGTLELIQAGSQGHKSINTGHWTAEEHRLFLQGLKEYGKKWTKIALLVQTRTALQVQSHAQKYHLKHDKSNPYSTMSEENQAVTSPAEGPVEQIQAGSQRHTSINTSGGTAEENRLYVQGLNEYGIPTAEKNAAGAINEESSNGKRHEDVCDHENVSKSVPTHARYYVSNGKYPREEKQELTSPAEGTVEQIQAGSQGHKSINTGRWTAEEHHLFLQGLKEYGNKSTKIASLVQSRTALQVRSHVHKYFLRHHTSKIDKLKMATAHINADIAGHTEEQSRKRKKAEEEARNMSVRNQRMKTN